MSMMDEIRANRAQQAADRRADRAAEREQDRADAAAAQERKRAERQQRQAAQAERAAARRARWSRGARWLAAHPVDVLTAAIIIVPGLLAWTAMAAYGQQLYGPHGTFLPLFTEAAMWAFAFRLHQARQAGQPTGWLQCGVWTFTAVAAALNYAHGHTLGGIGVGLVMAVVSTGGVIAHQLLTAAPMRTRRTRAQRRAARTERLAARRVVRMERAALRQAVGELATDGSVRLVHEPGTVTLARGWTGRARLDRTTVAGVGVDGPSATEDLATEVERWLSTRPDSPGESAPTEPTVGLDAAPVESRADLQESRADRAAVPEPSRRSIEVLRDQLAAAIADGAVEVDPTSAESIRRALRCGAKAARQLRDEWNDGSGVAA